MEDFSRYQAMEKGKEEEIKTGLICNHWVVIKNHILHIQLLLRAKCVIL